MKMNGISWQRNVVRRCFERQSCSPSRITLRSMKRQMFGRYSSFVCGLHIVIFFLCLAWMYIVRNVIQSIAVRRRSKARQCRASSRRKKTLFIFVFVWTMYVYRYCFVEWQIRIASGAFARRCAT